MKKLLLIAVTFFLLTSTSNATHVVGGDFQINWVSQNNYHIKLRYYRDDINGAVNMPATMSVGVYDAVTHQQIAIQTLSITSQSIVTLGDPCYNPDPNVVRIEEGIFESTNNLFLNNNPNGYYLNAQINARNALAINVTGATGNGTMVWFAMIPDPALGQNSTPDYGNYPADAYFCTTGPKLFSYPITDADGDSLAYSLVTPLDANTGSNGTFAGVGAYPFYPSLIYQGGFNFGSMIGGVPAFTINATTGQMIAAPTAQGFFTFAVRVEEFRDTTALGNGPKVKIGEVRRDVQYASLNCTSGNPPSFLNSVPSNADPLNPDTIQIPYNKLYCKDLIFNDLNATDTLYFEMISEVFDSGAYIPVMPLDLNNQVEHFYNWDGTTWLNSVVIDTNRYDSIEGAYWNIGTVASRFCWTPQCDEIGKFFPFKVNAFSLGCDGRSEDSVSFFLEVVPPITDFRGPNDTVIMYNYEHCEDITFRDTSIVDLLKIEITSPIFNLGATYPTLSNSYVYNDTIVTNVGNGDSNTVVLGTRFCWTPGCDQIDSTYTIQAVLSSVDCPDGIQDTLWFDYTVAYPTLNLVNAGDKSIPYGSEYCRSVTFEDSTVVDLLDIQIASEAFELGAFFPARPADYVYTSWGMQNVVTGVANDMAHNKTVATQFCWTPDCEHIGKTYRFKAEIFSRDCPSPLLYDIIEWDLTIDPPFDSLDVVPNVFTPNGDGVNDIFTLGYDNNGNRVGGTSNPCNDALVVDIYNRWGIRVFESADPTFEWDGKNKSGKDVPSGTYFVVISGIYGSETIEIEKRTLTLLR
jgi:gliding motility-associated-like protein